MFYRLAKLATSVELIEKETNLIVQIGVANGYKEGFIRKIGEKVFQKFKKTNEDNKEPARYISLTYHGLVSDKIACAFRKYNVRVGFRTKNKLGQILRHSVVPKPDKFSMAGVYKITCGYCNKFYIGQTGRTFNIRYREHSYSSNSSALGDHLREQQHQLKSIKDELSILYCGNKGNLLDICEEIAIYVCRHSSPDLLINDQLIGRRTWFFDLFQNLL